MHTISDANRYAWACVLLQMLELEIDGKEANTQHPMTYQSSLHKGSQLKWAILMKETCTIYMSVEKLAYNLDDVDITLKTDHLPLKMFSQKNTLNEKVNNWTIKISPFGIKLNVSNALRIH